MDNSPSQVSVTAREDVPPFGPVLPDPPIFTEVRNETKLLFPSMFQIYVPATARALFLLLLPLPVLQFSPEMYQFVKARQAQVKFLNE